MSDGLDGVSLVGMFRCSGEGEGWRRGKGGGVEEWGRVEDGERKGWGKGGRAEDGEGEVGGEKMEDKKE